MKLTKAMLVLLMILAAAFAGGAFSHFLLTDQPAKAQEVGNPKWLRTITLYLVDESTDQVRGILTIEGNGTASLSLRDDKGVDRLELDVDSSGSPRVKLHGKGGAGAELAIQDGQALLELPGSDGRLSLSLKDGPQFELMGSGQAGVKVSIEGGLPMLQMFDGGGNVVWQAPPEEEPESE